MYKIPKRIFFYWGGGNLSWMRYMTLYSFRKCNPTWEMIMYYNEDASFTTKPWACHNEQDFHYYNGPDYLDRLDDLNIKIKKWDLSDNKIVATDLKVSPSQKSNFLKWAKLYEEGGIFSDMDILYFRPMDKFYNAMREADVAICQTDYLSIGLLASSKNSLFYKDIFINGINNFDMKSYQTAGVNNVYNLYSKVKQSEVLKTAKIRYPNIKFYNIPMDLVYHLDSTKIKFACKNALSINDFPKSAIGYHWYAGHPIIQKYNNILNEDSYRNYNTTFTSIAKEIIDTDTKEIIDRGIEEDIASKYEGEIN